MDRAAADVGIDSRSGDPRASRSISRRTQLLAALSKNLGGNLVWAIAPWQPDQSLVMPLAEMADLAKTMARPADGEEDQSDVRARDHGLECLDRLVFFGLDPEE